MQIDQSRHSLHTDRITSLIKNVRDVFLCNNNIMIRIRLLVYDMYRHASREYEDKYPLALSFDLLQSVDTAVSIVKRR